MKVVLFICEWMFQTGVAFDRFLNAFLLFGSAQETISRRMGRHHHRCHICRFLCRVLNVITFQDDHCGARETDSGSPSQSDKQAP